MRGDPKHIGRYLECVRAFMLKPRNSDLRIGQAQDNFDRLVDIELKKNKNPDYDSMKDDFPGSSFFHCDNFDEEFIKACEKVAYS